MKTRNLVFAFTMILSQALLGQSDHAVLHFINDAKTVITVGQYPTIQLNNNLIGTSDPYSHIKYTVYSEGNVSIISRSNICTTLQVNVDIKKGNEYYFHAQYRKSGYSGRKPCLEQISQEEAKELLASRKIRSTIELAEDKDNPIAKLNPRQDKKGTGFLVNSNGYILTNSHVIEDAKTIKVKGIGGDFSSTFEAIVIANDRSTDLALLKVTSSIISFDSPTYFNGDVHLQKGESVYALGYPLTESMGEEIKITKGVA